MIMLQRREWSLLLFLEVCVAKLEVLVDEFDNVFLVFVQNVDIVVHIEKVGSNLIIQVHLISNQLYLFSQ